MAGNGRSRDIADGHAEVYACGQTRGPTRGTVRVETDPRRRCGSWDAVREGRGPSIAGPPKPRRRRTLCLPLRVPVRQRSAH